jgi:hypothetical protein
MKKPKHKPKKKSAWLNKFSDAITSFLVAVAEARVPPSKMTLVPRQGSINLATGFLGVVLFTAAGQINASTRDLSLASQFLMALIGAALLFVAAVVVIFVSRRADAIVNDWNRTASVFIVVWLLALVVFVILNYPLLLITDNFILLDRVAYPLTELLFGARAEWKYNLVRSMICTFLGGLILIYRTKRVDKKFSLKSVEPWVWLALMTVVVGLVFDVSLYQLPR